MKKRGSRLEELKRLSASRPLHLWTSAVVTPNNGCASLGQNRGSHA